MFIAEESGMLSGDALHQQIWRRSMLVPPQPKPAPQEIAVCSSSAALSFYVLDWVFFGMVSFVRFAGRPRTMLALSAPQGAACTFDQGEREDQARRQGRELPLCRERRRESPQRRCGRANGQDLAAFYALQQMK